MKKQDALSVLLPTAVLAAALGAWAIVSRLHVFPDYAFPAPASVAQSFAEEIRARRLFDDIVASLFRVVVGFTLAVVTGVPVGLWMGQSVLTRLALLPAVNFNRSLSPLAWIPFAILWFHVGDRAAIFLIYMASVFPLILATVSAVASIPRVYFRVGQDFGMRGWERLTRVTLPAVLPQLVTALRVTAGIAWVVVVAAEMVGCQDGLGYGIYDARNGLRTDTVVCYMIVIGLLGIGIDRLLASLSRLPNLRWGYDR